MSRKRSYLRLQPQVYSREVECSTPNCKCYPWGCFKCIECEEFWYTNLPRGQIPNALCCNCRKEIEKETDKTLWTAVRKGYIKTGDKDWWRTWVHGTRAGIDLQEIPKAKLEKVECDRGNWIPDEYKIKAKEWQEAKYHWKRGRHIHQPYCSRTSPELRGQLA